MIRLKKISLALVIVALFQVACESDSVSKIKHDVDKAASILNTAAKTNRALFQNHEITLAQRKAVATAVGEANEYLSDAVELAAQLQPGQSGDQVIAILEQAVQRLAATHVGNPKVDLVIQGAITSINSAILLARQLKGNK